MQGLFGTERIFASLKAWLETYRIDELLDVACEDANTRTIIENQFCDCIMANCRICFDEKRKSRRAFPYMIIQSKMMPDGFIHRLYWIEIKSKALKGNVYYESIKA